MNIFQEIKETIPLYDIAASYGIQLNRSNMCSCPFHEERTPSMKIHDKGFCCYGCGEHGDTIKFVQKLFGLENPLDAAHKINEDFHLGIDVSRRPTVSEVTAAQIAIKDRMETQQRYNQTADLLIKYFRTLQEYKELAPKSPLEIPDKRFIEYLHNIEKLDFVMEQHMDMSNEPLSKRKEFLNDYNNYFSNIAQRVHQIEQEIISHYNKTGNLLKEYSGICQKHKESMPKTALNNLRIVMNEHSMLSGKPISMRKEFLDKYHDYFADAAQCVLKYRQEKHTEQKITSKSINTAAPTKKTVSDSSIIGNTPYRNINNKAYLKYSNTFAPLISDKLKKQGIQFSGKIYSKLTTFTVDQKDLPALRRAAADVAADFTAKNNPQLIPSQQITTQTKSRQSIGISR